MLLQFILSKVEAGAEKLLTIEVNYEKYKKLHRKLICSVKNACKSNLLVDTRTFYERNNSESSKYFRWCPIAYLSAL